MDKLSRLFTLENELDDLIGNSDFELAHSEADKILIEIIKTLASGDKYLEAMSAQLIEKYDSVGKWYA